MLAIQRLRGFILGSLLAGMTLAAPSTAFAKQSQNYQYRFSQVWSGTFRLVRVDMECKVTDRDDEIGFLMFQYTDGDRSYPGSIQLVPVRENGKDLIRVEIQIPSQPTYVEIMILDKLRKKLASEYGEPVEVPPPADKDKPKDDEDAPKEDKDGNGDEAPAPDDRAPPKDKDKDDGDDSPRR